MLEEKRNNKPDVVLKKYWGNKEQFSDFFNAVLFDGKTVIRPEELEDFKKELNGINLTDDVFFGGLGFYNLNDDTMDLSTNPKAYGIVKTTLVHELGHGVSSKYKYEENKGKLSNLPNYSYSKDFEKYEKIQVYVYSDAPGI